MSSPARHPVTHGDTPGLEGFLWHFWTLMIHAVEEDERLHARVLDILAHLKARESPAGWRIWGVSVKVWSSLSLFGPVVREEFNGPRPYVDNKAIHEWSRSEADLLAALHASPSADDRAQAIVAAGRRYLALHHFLASAWALDLFPSGELYALWAMRPALEYAADSPQYERVPRALEVEAAAAWVAHAAGRMYACKEIFGPQGHEGWPATKGAPGRGGEKWDGVDGYDPKRWQLWKAGFEEVVRDKGEQQHVKRAAEVALVAMERAEQEADGN